MRDQVRIFLGGADLEMEAIRRLALEVLGASAIDDKRLRWGACASSYLPEITATLSRGQTALLIELKDDLPRDLDRSRIVLIDHHDTRAGAEKPSSLRQLFRYLELPPARWTREFDLIEANDIGHIRGLRAMGATPAEIMSIRAADRKAQGITRDVEAGSRAAIAGRENLPGLTLIETGLSTASAITDFMEPELGGPGAANLLVVMPGKLGFYGDGRIIAELRDTPGCWYGGALPERGFWGVECSAAIRNGLVERITRLAAALSARAL